ncbi:hypothetical protein H0H81_007800 [Sphagnurus paluster]|uniref:Uncharacterized protein n=1 Tax=Sphagnurus paluster TaxID=117069 RepID=A0A9P7KLD2_9AGAR|nr:hypothetical protein H0H81_007800 [Sphagnurus paluster]
MRSDHTRQHAEHSRRDLNAPRDSQHSKLETDYLHYYQSSIADGRLDESDQESAWSPQLSRQTSGSTSPSDYSDSPATDFSSTTAQSRSSQIARRSKVPSDGGSDRRRLAIVQMDSLVESRGGNSREGSQPSTLRSRRGIPSNLSGLALVAPPDAAPKSYSHLTPPTTAPVTGDTTRRDATRDDKGHHRSASEVTKATSAKPSFRDAVTSGSDRPEARTTRVIELCVSTEGDGLSLPADQASRHSRSPSPGRVPGVSDQLNGLLSPVQPGRPGIMKCDTQTPLIVTPEIGEEKDIGTRVAAPVIISLESAGPFRRRETPNRNDHSSAPEIVLQPASATPYPKSPTSHYLHYEPGVHATAGPLPPPPRAMFNIDIRSPAPPRPPRLNSPLSTRSRGEIEAVKQALQLPPSVAAALASRTLKPNVHDYTEPPETRFTSLEGSATDTEAQSSTRSSGLRHANSLHRREGAFPPSTSTSTGAVSDSETQMAPRSDITPSSRPHGDAKSLEDTKTPSIPVPNSHDGPPITLGYSMQPINEQQDEVMASLQPSRRPSNESSRSQHVDHSGETPSPPPKSFRNSLTSSLKKFSSSLPRTPSLSSKSRRSSETYYSSRTPSPSSHMATLPPAFHPKIKSAHPPAMFCTEVMSGRTSLERCTIYAEKINELYLYDSGLGDWIFDAKLRSNNHNPAVVFSSHNFTPQPRHTSRASMISEITFPRRPDASTATDLSVKTQDLIPTTPPALPYPSLANQLMYPTRSSSVASGNSSLRSLTSSAPTSKTPGGFFASLGRKASMNSAKKPLLTPSNNSPARLLTKSPPTPITPRTITLTNVPSVPGGPRAAPHHRAARSQTIMTTANPFNSNPSALFPEHSEGLGRRPSLYDINSYAEPPVVEIVPDPEFVRQVDKLVHLLPDANREVLAGYLRRAGQDILAIGQYLEDEKNGTIKAP